MRVGGLGHNAVVLLRELVQTSEAVAATSGRTAKITEIAGLLRRAGPGEVPVVVAFLSGELRQRQIGVGYASLGELLRLEPSGGGPLTVAETDAVFEAVGQVAGAGAQAERRRLLAVLFGRASQTEREFLVRLLAGELHQGALEGVMVEAVARAAGVPAAEVRRAHLLAGSLPLVAQAALTAAWPAALPTPQPRNQSPTRAALATLGAFGLKVGQPLRPMLASSAADRRRRVRAPVARGRRVEDRRDPGPGTPDRDRRRRVHQDARRHHHPGARDRRGGAGPGRAGGGVRRGGHGAGPDGRPRPFQVTASRTGSHMDVARQRADTPLTPFFFDLLHLDGTDLIDEPAHVRQARLAAVMPARLLVPRLVTEDLDAAVAFFADAVGRGHEGVVVKSPMPGTRPAGAAAMDQGEATHTLDLVVLAAEWGHGRAPGWLSNLHLGARDPAPGAGHARQDLQGAHRRNAHLADQTAA